MEADRHPSQPERLAALRSYDILDTPRETDFDDIVELASQICGTPISVVNLIDQHRQWFKAEVGLGARETPLETSICSHVILSEDFVQIEDTHADPRTADNELCMPDDGLRFYAGALLKTENGLPIGTLCVLDNKPRRLTEHQCFAIKVLARRVMRELDLRRALRDQDILRDEMDHRIKNSLASVASTVRLHSREAQRTGEVAPAFDAVQRQLSAVAAVHQGIYSSTGTDVDAGEYLATLGRNLDASLPDNVAVTTKSPDVCIAPDLASAFGLVVNEFAANTVKHGLAIESGTKIEYLLEQKNQSLVLTCSNNLSTQEKHDNDRPGLGSRLMRASLSKHGGKVEELAGDTGHTLIAAVPLSHD